MNRLFLLLVLGAFVTGGCASSSAPEASYAKPISADKDVPAKKDKAGPPKPQGPGQVEAAVREEVQRKIIYTARAELVVESFEQAQKALLQLIDEQKGYVASSEVQGSPGTRRYGTWTVRVPVANFRAFLTALEQLGEPHRNQTDSQDVTDEFYDLEARIKNKRVEEERLLEHLKKSTGKLEDILAVERELTRVRGEIETAQGRLQKISKLTELTTVTVSLQERKDYVPERAPTFGTSIGRTFEGSIQTLLTVAKGLLLAVVAVVPWLLVLGGVAAPIWLLVRRSRPQPARQLPSIPTVQPVERPGPPAPD